MDSLLPSHCYLIGYGRKEISDDEFREYIRSSIGKHSRRKITEKVWNSLKDNLSFHAGSYDNIEDFNSLNSRIDAMEKALNQGVQCLFYISTPPSVFKAILENLGTSGLAKRHRNTQIESKVIIEKPFGRDLKSANELNAVINRRFSETQVFRIDHYLGKKRYKAYLFSDLQIRSSSQSGIGIMYPVYRLQYLKILELAVGVVIMTAVVL